jgi:hypothetical protein
MTDRAPASISPEDQTEMTVLRTTLERVEAMVGHELGLIGTRMTWFAISQSFLFGAYATIATDPARLERLARAAAATQPVAGAITVRFLLFALPIVGIFFAVAAYLSVQAAERVLRHLDHSRGRLIERLNRALSRNGYETIPVLGTPTQRDAYSRGFGRTSAFGRVPQWMLPWIMVVVWLLAFLGRFNLWGFWGTL